MAKFQETFCSQCGKAFGPGDSGFSHCQDHRGDNMIEQRKGRMKKTTREYRGKYPNRIREVWTNSEDRRFAFVKINNGKVFKIAANSTNGKFPTLGKEIADYEYIAI